jgi:tRNA1(Val) A37 N6-methylase TrmN6
MNWWKKKAVPESGLLDGERLDELGVRGWRLIQHPDVFRFSLDAVLLAHFAHIGRSCRAADLGTGTGAVALLLLSLGVSSVDAVERQSRLADMLKRSVTLNDLEASVRVLHGDVRQVDQFLPSGAYDLVTANPPFRMPDTGRISPNAGIAEARHEEPGTLRDFLGAAVCLLKQRGRFAMVHLPERIVDIISAMRDLKLEPKRMRFVHSFIDKPARMVLVEGIKHAKPGLDMLPPLVVYDSPGNYCPEIMAYYQQER